MSAELVRIENVPLLRTGQDYPLSTGPRTFTEEDLQAAVAALANDPAVRPARIKIDGLAESFDPDAHGGEPALGWIEDLAVSANGQELTGTLVVPDWLEAVADFAYPNRSVEGFVHATTATGQSHDFVLTAVALLGVDLPGISTLPDLAEFLNSGPAGAAPAPEAIAASAKWEGDPVKAGMDQEIVRRRLMDWIQGGADGQDLPESNDSVWDLWPVALRFDDQGKPYAKVMDEGTGRLYSVSIAVSGNDVTFGPFVEVMEQDVPVAAAADRPAGKVWASRADVRPTPTDEETDMDIAALREAAGLTAEQLPDDATPEQVTEAMRLPVEPPEEEEEVPTPEAPAETPEPVAASAKLPEGVVAIDKATLETLQAGAQTAQQIAAKQAREDRDRVIASAVREGRFAPAQRENYERLWDSDPDGTRKLLTASAEDGGLAPNTISVEARATMEQDTGGQQDNGRGTGLFDHLYEKQGA